MKQDPEWGTGLFYLTMTTAPPGAYRTVGETMEWALRAGHRLRHFCYSFRSWS